MSLAHKLYRVGILATKNDIREIIEVKKGNRDNRTIQIDFKNDAKDVTVNHRAIDDFSKFMFTKKIGGTSNSYYLYPNFEFLKESNIYKKFKLISYTFENSILKYANKKNREIAKKILEYIKNYNRDRLKLKEYPKDDYYLVITVEGESLYELMPEVWDNYYNQFVNPHITKKVKGKEQPQLREEIDFITQKREICGYNPNVKFFTMDNYSDRFKYQIIDKFPMSKETAITIKKGWMYAITHLKFNYKGLEYIIIPSMVDFDRKIYTNILRYLKKSNSDIKSISSREDSFINRLSNQIENFDSSIVNRISLDILFTEVNTTNLSVKIFATLEDVLPSRINSVVKEMKKFKISASIKREESGDDLTYLRDYFSRDELFAISKKNKEGMKNRVLQERIFLNKILLGYEQIDYIDILKRFEFNREFNFENRKRIIEQKGVKSWIEFPNGYVKDENRVLEFLKSIKAIRSE